MNDFFKNQYYGTEILKHKKLPIYRTDQFSFYRCIEFTNDFYKITVSELHNGNLRVCQGRYSKLFPNQKISYWANSPKTAIMEIKKHDSSNNILTFWAYDDASSTFPTISSREPLIIIDGRKCGIQQLIDKADADEDELLTEAEQQYLNEILDEKPDCLVYDSHACKGGENYIFFEKGFKKLAIRELSLKLGENKSKNRKRIVCAETSDYSPDIDKYGNYFLPITKVGFNKAYYNSEEYLERKRVLELSHREIQGEINE